MTDSGSQGHEPENEGEHPAFAVGEPLRLALPGRHVRYSLDMGGKLVVIEAFHPA